MRTGPLTRNEVTLFVIVTCFLGLVATIGALGFHRVEAAGQQLQQTQARRTFGPEAP